MKKWEETYEQYKNGEMKARFAQLKAKVDTKTCSKEEYAEFSTMQKINDNLPKVDNLFKYIDGLEQNLEILKKEYNARQAEEKAPAIKQKLENQLQQIMQKQEIIESKRKEIRAKLNTSGLSDKEKAKLEKEDEKLEKSYQDLNKERDNNNKEYLINETKAEAIKKNPVLEGYSKEEIRKECFDISTKISKANLVANNLMKGLSRDSIEVKLQNWKDRKFTSKDPLPLTRKERGQKEKQNDDEPQKDKKDEPKTLTPEEIAKQLEQDKIDAINALYGEPNTQPDTDPNLPAEINKFEQQFPRLSKFLPKIFKNSKVADKIANANQERKEKKELKEGKENEEPTKTDSLKEDRQKFIKDLKDFDILDVADKGLDDLRQNQKDKVKEKYEAAKKAAYDREKSTYGEDYAKKSYEPDEEER